MNKVQIKSHDEVKEWLPWVYLCVFLLIITAAQAQAVAVNGKDTVQPSAQAQINAILAEKKSRTPAEAKLDSNLLSAIRSIAPVANSNLQSQPAYVQDFVRNHIADDLTVKVTIRAKVTKGLLTALKAARAREISSFVRYGTVTARIPADQLLAIAARSEVRFIEVFIPGTTNLYNLTPEALRIWQESAAKFPGPIGNIGEATSQGVVAHAVDKVQQTGINGTGVKVCVLSDGVDSLEERQESGDLPASVDVVAGQAGSGDEGTAMLEIIHDMAPNAKLGFATAQGGDAQMATNIKTLRNAPHNCNIIVDDITYPFEPPFQEGIIAQAVTTVTAGGALYFSSSANSGSKIKGTSGTWEGDFVNAGSTSFPANGTVHSFGSTIANTLTQAADVYVLMWGDPQSGSNNDYDLFILDSTLNSVLGVSDNTQDGDEPPREYISGSALIPAGSKIVVVNYQGDAQVRALRLDTHRGRLSVNTNGNTYGHNGGVNTISTGAVSAETAGGGVFVGDAANPVETFSSDGPRRLFYTPAGAEITPGNILFGTSGGTLLNKVDIAAADCVTTTTPGFIPFCGTSAAAPHAAAIAALIMSAKPGLTRTQIMSALTTSALDIEAVGYDYNAGNGLIMADTSVRSVLNPIGVAKAFSPASITIGGSSTLKVTLTNTNDVALKNIALTDTYPANLKNDVAPSAQLTGSGCTGTVAATAGGASVALSGATIPARGTCILKVNVTSAMAGTYADGSGSVTTPMRLNSASTIATLVVTAGASPDFVVTGVTLSPISPLYGPFSAIVTVKNQGTAAGNGGYLDVWTNEPTVQSCSADGNGFAVVGRLAAGASKTLTIKGLRGVEPGAMTLRAFVDSACKTTESSEGNNQFSLTYNVSKSVDFVITSVKVNSASPKVNSTFSATVVIKNQGTVAGDGGYLDVWANQPTNESCPADGNAYVAVGTLAAGASKTFNVTGLRAREVGAMTLRAFVNSYCQTVESSDANNQLTKAYSVVP